MGPFDSVYNLAQGIRLRAVAEGRSRMAARLGLEPRQAESESAVLPLHHQAVEIKQGRARRDEGKPRRSGAGDGI